MPRARSKTADLLGEAAGVIVLREAVCHGDPAAAAALAGALQASAAYLREVAARSIAQAARALDGEWPGGLAGSARAAEALATVMRQAADGGAAADPGCRVRQEAVIALGELRVSAERAEAPLRQAVSTVQLENVGGEMEDTAVTLRGNAALVMAQLGCDCLCDLGLLLFDGLPDLERKRDPKRAARVAAARALGLLGRSDAAAPLAIRLRETQESGEVLAECIDALRALRHPRTAEWTAPLLDSAEPLAAVAAASTLCALQPAAALPKVLARIGGSGEALAEALTTVLAGARAVEATAALRRLVRDRRPRVRAAARAALEERGEGCGDEAAQQGGGGKPLP